MANSEIIGAGQDAARRAPKIILDACCGGRSFWFDRSFSNAVFGDKRTEKIKRGPYKSYPSGQFIVVVPDVLYDFTHLPFPADTFYHVVFDPPHMAKIGESSFLKAKYGKLSGEWKKMLRCGFAECFRVLKTNGTLIFKWCEYETPISEILKLTPVKPMYGHRSGKAMKTHWVCFMKQESSFLGEESPAQNTMEICHTSMHSPTPCLPGAYGHCPLGCADGAVHIDEDGRRYQPHPNNCIKYEDVRECMFSQMEVDKCNPPSKP